MVKKAVESVEDNIQVLAPITPRQQRLIESLLCGKSLRQSARNSGVSIRSVIYWLNDPRHPVRIEYEKQCAAMREEFRTRIVGLHAMAITALEELLGADAPAPIRFQAAKMIYEAHLAPLAAVEQPVGPDEMIASIVEDIFDPLSPARRNQIYLYDDRGQERLQLDD